MHPQRFTASLPPVFFSPTPIFALSAFAQTDSGTAKASGASAGSQESVTQMDTLAVTAKTGLPPAENWLTATIPVPAALLPIPPRANPCLLQT